MPDPTGKRPAQVPLLERTDLTPAERARVGRAATAVLAISLAAIVAIGLLAIWHLVRRGRLIRERLGATKIVRLPDLDRRPTDPSPPAEG